MRIARLDLDRYGRFTDTSLPLPKQGTDLHVIYGPNEAGKSTTRKALTEVLFGFEKSTPFAFLHDYSELRVRALVDVDEAPLEVVRRKTLRASLIDPAGQAIDDALWRQVLGSTDRAFFERMFALDHHLLVAGGKAMLDSHSDVGRMLFQAAAGLSHFNQVRAELNSEAALFWASRKKGDVRYFEARARVDTASRALKEHALSESMLATLQRACAQAETLTETARQRRIQAHVRISQLERIRRVAPKLQQLALVEADVAAAEGVKLLPVDARELMRTVNEKASAADTAARSLAEAIDAQVQRRDALQVDDQLLPHAEAIDALARAMSSVEKEVVDLPKRKVEREQLRRELAQTLADLGFPAIEPSEIVGRLPRAPQRERLRGMAGDFAEHQRNLAARMAGVETASSAAASLRSELERAPAPEERSWSELISAAAGVLESANARQLSEAVESAQRSLRAHLETLGWTGAPEALRLVRPPGDAQIASWLDGLAEQRSVSTDLSRERRDAEAQLAHVTAEITLLQQDAVPDQAALLGARSVRDQMLDELVAGSRSVVEEGEAFRGLVRSADDIVDRRYAEAQAAAKMDGLLATQGGLRARLQILSEQAAEASRATEQLHVAWSTAAASAGLNGVSLEAAQVWNDDRRRALLALDAFERARAAHDAFVAAADQAGTGLAQALGREKPAGIGAAAWLQTLLNEARSALQSAQAQQVRRAELERQIDEQEKRIAQERTAVELLRAAQSSWQAEWTAACADAGLPGEVGPRGLDRVLEAIDELRSKASRFAEQVEARILPMERNVSAFNQRVHECVAAAAPALAEMAPFDAVRALSRSLQDARDAARARLTLDESIDAQRDKHRQRVQERDAALARLNPLLQTVGATDVADLESAIAASETRRSLEVARSQLVEGIIEHGEGRDLPQLREEVEGVALDQPEVLLAEARQEHAAAEDQQQATQAEAILAKDRLQKLGGDEHAARARSDKASAQREMADAVEAFVGLQTQSLLLDWALKRYREEKQGPLLQRASEFFNKLTCGEHARLLAEEDDGAVTLFSRRAGQAAGRIGVDAMSEGTRDQLYLALRMAALELHLERNVALPFIADDLLVNFDDRRATAALGCLAELSRRTQVLYFTHHRHLLDLAREAVGRGLNVIELN